MAAEAETGTGYPSPLRGEGGAQRRVRGSVGKIAVSRARTLRQNQTDPERRLWNILRNRSFHGLKFVRQLPVGPFIVDFACRELMLIVEVDGSQHVESERDASRTAFLNRNGYAVLRFWNNEITEGLNGVHAVLTAIVERTDVPSPGWRYSPATLSPEGRGAPTASLVPGSKS